MHPGMLSEVGKGTVQRRFNGVHCDFVLGPERAIVVLIPLPILVGGINDTCAEMLRLTYP